MTAPQDTFKGTIFALSRALLVSWLMYAAFTFMLSDPPHDTKEKTSAKNQVQASYILDAFGLHYISTWQICSFFETNCGFDGMCPDSDCSQFNSHPFHKTRLDILAHAPGIGYGFDIGDSQYPIEARISRHLVLARRARAELEHRFPIDVNVLRNVGDVCIDLPQFNVTIANILPWYDVFNDWDRKLGYKISLKAPALIKYEPELEYIHRYIRQAVGYINQILDVRSGERFKQLVTMYEKKECGLRNKRP
ncbi:hypothetical protein F4859DRAFT_513470 [Xylaria cf. heliscus]|nr:hypothetical protein F4859DRAFT_513470 [Xylaria cf. heliscus]